MPSDPASRRRYALAPLFQIRVAGVPFDVLEPLATPRAIALAREIGERTAALDAAARAAFAALRDRMSGAAEKRRKWLRRAIGARLALRLVPEGAPPEVDAYQAAFRALAELRLRRDEVLREELDAVARALRAAARAFLPDYSLFASADVEALAFRDGGGRFDWPRDRTLLMYVQRLATKNETLSAFGPSAWGTVDPHGRGLRLEPRAGLARHAYLERWVAQAVVAAMNGDRFEDGLVIPTAE